MALKGRKIMLAADHSDFSLRALQYACEHIVTGQDELLIVNVRPVVEERDFYASESYRVEFETEYADRSEHLLGKLAKAAEAFMRHGPAKVVTRSVAGDPRRMLLETAEDYKPALVVVGSHGRGLLSRALLGSVSEYLVQSSPCPVLVVRPSHEAASSPIPGLDQLGKIVQSAT